MPASSAAISSLSLIPALDSVTLMLVHNLCAGDLFPVLDLLPQKRANVISSACAKCFFSPLLIPLMQRSRSSGVGDGLSPRSGHEEEMTAEPTARTSPSAQLVAAKDKEVSMSQSRRLELMKSLPNSMTHESASAVGASDGPTSLHKNKCSKVLREINRQHTLICTPFHPPDLATGRNGQRKEQHD